jgi:CrcB protein
MARYAVDRVAVAQLGSSLTGTFVANVSGSFVLGLLVGLLSSHPAWPGETRIFLAVGFLASYTTFSTLSVATIQQLEKGDISSAAVNLGTSVVLGLAAAAAGIVLGRAI